MMADFTVNILTIFPEMFPGPLSLSVSGRALKNNIWTLNIINIRDFAQDSHKSVDDKPYGGGAGMLMRPDIVGNAIDHILSHSAHTKLIFMSPTGTLLNQDISRQLINFSNITILCGHFEGVDRRIIDFYSFNEISIGNYILSGGEIASMVLVDTLIRLLPNVLGNNQSLYEESFNNNQMLEYPQYTRPALWKGLHVPDVLLSGHHQKIKAWQNKQSSFLTKKNRGE